VEDAVSYMNALAAILLLRKQHSAALVEQASFDGSNLGYRHMTISVRIASPNA
jgi:hypothetical protein